MSTCRVCGSISFEENEGFSYCQECGTQVETFQREEATDEMVTGGGRWASQRAKTKAPTATGFAGGAGASQEPALATNVRERRAIHFQDVHQQILDVLRQKPLIRQPSADAGDNAAHSAYAGRRYYDDLALDSAAGQDRHSGTRQTGTQQEDEREESDNDEHQADRPPCTLVEGFQTILRAQVDALVCAGYPTELEDVVGQIWFLYLRYAGLAFTGDAAKEEKLHKSFQAETVRKKKVVLTRGKRQRAKTAKQRKKAKSSAGQDAATATGQVSSAAAAKLSTPRDGLRRTRSQTSRRVQFDETPRAIHIQERHSDSDDSGTMSDYREQRLQEGLEEPDELEDESEENGGSGEATDDDDGDTTGSHMGDFTRRSWSGRQQCLKQPRLLHLLAINLLALLSLGEPVLASDMCNFTRQGLLPYFNCDYVFDERMRLYNHQYSYFQPQRMPCPTTIYNVAHELAISLELSLPPIDVESILCRYLRELLFPAQLASCAHRLLLLAPLPLQPVVSGKTRQRAWRDTDLDVCIMATLVVLVKLIYGLDDSTEWRQAVYSKTIRWNMEKQSPVEDNDAGLIPVWQEWLRLYSDQLRGSLSSPSLHHHRHAGRVVQDCEALLKERCGTTLMRRPSTNLQRQVYAMRKDSCYQYRHSFLQAASGSTATCYAPTVPHRFQQAGPRSTQHQQQQQEHEQQRSDPAVVVSLQGFPLQRKMGAGNAQAEGSDGAPIDPTDAETSVTCVTSGESYVHYKHSAQLHLFPSIALLLDICSSHIGVDVRQLRRQVQQVEGRMLKASSADMIVNSKEFPSCGVHTHTYAEHTASCFCSNAEKNNC